MMKIATKNNLDTLLGTYPLRKEDIESQVLSDLSRYRRGYYTKYKKSAPNPLDVDNYVQELWEFSICFEAITQNSEEVEILGFLRPETRQIIVDESCTNQRRISFTIAHEAGHLSLHAPLFSFQGNLVNGWKQPEVLENHGKKNVAEIRREWQANTYAGSLLAPKPEVEAFLRELGLIKNLTFLSFNLDEHFSKFEERFGLSRQALEIRLEHLGVPAVSTRCRTI